MTWICIDLFSKKQEFWGEALFCWASGGTGDESLWVGVNCVSVCTVTNAQTHDSCCLLSEHARIKKDWQKERRGGEAADARRESAPSSTAGCGLTNSLAALQLWSGCTENRKEKWRINYNIERKMSAIQENTRNQTWRLNNGITTRKRCFLFLFFFWKRGGEHRCGSDVAVVKIGKEKRKRRRRRRRERNESDLGWQAHSAGERGGKRERIGN